MKLYKLIILSILIYFVACKNSNQEMMLNKTAPQNQLTILKSDSVYVVLKNEKDYPFPNHAKPVDLSFNEITLVDSLLKIAISDYNKKINEKIKQLKIKNSNISGFYSMLDYSAYYYQLVPVINDSDEKVIWINSICKSADSQGWRNDIFIIFDGGNCYFNLKINLTKREFYNFMVNGVS